MLLTGLIPWLAQSVFVYSQGLLLRGSTTHSGLSPSPSIINKEKSLQACLKANLMEVFSQLRFPFPDMTRLVSG